MNKWLVYLDRIDIIRMFHFFILIFMLSSMFVGPWTKLPLVIAATINLIYYNKTIEKWSCVLYSLYFMGTWYMSYYSLANHRTLLGIFTLYVTYRVWCNDQKWNFPFFLLSFVIIIATLQKVLSSYFMDGNLVGELFLSGASYSQLGPFLDSNFEAHAQFFRNEFYNIRFTHDSVSLPMTEASILFSKVFTWVILISEILLSIALVILSPKKKYVAIFLFLIGTALFRSEFGFFSTLCVICCFDINIQNTRIQQLIKLLFLIFAVIFCYISVGKFQ